MAFITREVSSSARDAIVAARSETTSLRNSYTSSGLRPVPLGGLPDVRQARDRRFARAACGPFWLPLMVLGALLVALDGNNPFYTQERIGRNGRVFRIMKLRSMVPGADEVLVNYLVANPEARAEWDATQKLKSDPRITTVGRILRKTSLDELPQLINVLVGDMSLVGPRPIMVNQKALYPGRRYYDMRPGLTGLWQVSDRNDCAFVERVRFDDAYHRIMSFWTDAAILVRTIKVVVRGTGY
jgi:exopolysaccharide production protein ExoY